MVRARPPPFPPSWGRGGRDGREHRGQEGKSALGTGADEPRAFYVDTDFCGFLSFLIQKGVSFTLKNNIGERKQKLRTVVPHGGCDCWEMPMPSREEKKCDGCDDARRTEKTQGLMQTNHKKSLNPILLHLEGGKQGRNKSYQMEGGKTVVKNIHRARFSTSSGDGRVGGNQLRKGFPVPDMIVYQSKYFHAKTRKGTSLLRLYIISIRST